MKKSILLLCTSAVLFFSNCSKSDDNDDNGGDDSCLADAITLTETKVNDLAPSSNNVIISFDAKNTSSKNYSVNQGSKAVYVKVVVTTTDGSTYESSQILTVTSLSAGATASTDVLASYGTGKTYKSYAISSKYCQ